MIQTCSIKCGMSSLLIVMHLIFACIGNIFRDLDDVYPVILHLLIHKVSRK